MIAWTSKAASFLGGVATFVIMVLIVFDVLMRYFLNEPQLFVDELVSFLQVLVVFWGLAHTFRDRGHIRVDLVTSHLPVRVRGWLRVMTLLVGIGLLGIVASVTWTSAWTAYGYGRVSAVMLYPIWLPMLLIPTGIALMTVSMVATLVRQVRALVVPGGSGGEIEDQGPAA